MPKRLPGMSYEWQQFCAAVVIQLAFPLFPFVVELMYRGYITDTTLCIVAAMYAVSVGGNTRNMALLAAGLFVGMSWACLFGLAVGGEQLHWIMRAAVYTSMVVFFGIHAAERFNRHVMDGEVFSNYGKDQ